MFALLRRRDARLAAQWERALQLGGPRSPLQVHRYASCQALGEVVGHRQRARRGTKARVRWVADGQTTAAWFWGTRPSIGTYVLATGEYGSGTQHPEDVFYVAVGSFEVIPARALRAYTPRPEAPGSRPEAVAFGSRLCRRPLASIGGVPGRCSVTSGT